METSLIAMTQTAWPLGFSLMHSPSLKMCCDMESFVTTYHALNLLCQTVCSYGYGPTQIRNPFDERDAFLGGYCE